MRPICSLPSPKATESCSTHGPGVAASARSCIAISSSSVIIVSAPSPHKWGGTFVWGMRLALTPCWPYQPILDECLHDTHRQIDLVECRHPATVLPPVTYRNLLLVRAEVHLISTIVGLEEHEPAVLVGRFVFRPHLAFLSRMEALGLYEAHYFFDFFSRRFGPFTSINRLVSISRSTTRGSIRFARSKSPSLVVTNLGRSCSQRWLMMLKGGSGRNPFGSPVPRSRCARTARTLTSSSTES